MNKRELRKIYKQKRQKLVEAEKERLEKNIYNQFFNFDLSAVKTVHLFLSIKRHKEINTEPIIDFLRSNNKKIVVSKCHFLDSTLTHYLLEEDTLIRSNSWGIPEPLNAKQIDIKEIDLVLVPMLISDKKNYRVGYGKGFYDKFLSECKPEIKTIGLNFFSPIDVIVDVNNYDVALDYVLYPKE